MFIVEISLFDTPFDDSSWEQIGPKFSNEKDAVDWAVNHDWGQIPTRITAIPTYSLD